MWNSDFAPMAVRNLIGKMFEEGSRSTQGFRKMFNYPMSMSLRYEDEKKEGNPQSVILEAALAGIPKENIKVSIPDENTIEIRVQNLVENLLQDNVTVCYNNISRKESSVQFSTIMAIDKKKTQVSYRDGVLRIELCFKKPDEGYVLEIK